MKLRELASGRWAEILTALGVDPVVLNGKHHPCPGCGGTDRFRFIRDDKSGGYFCSDHRGDGFKLLEHIKGCDFAEAAKMVESVVGTGERTRVERKPLPIVKNAEPIRESRYLASRGLETPKSLRFGYAMDEGIEWPVMAADVIKGGARVGLHLTYLEKAQKRAHTPRKLHGENLTGGAVQLYPLTETLGIAEGIETAIAAKMLHGIPVWAALNTSLLKGFLLPEGVKELVIFADSDENFAGQAAAYHLAHRLHGSCNVEIALPQQGDWNDVLLSKVRAA